MTKRFIIFLFGFLCFSCSFFDGRARDKTLIALMNFDVTTFDPIESNDNVASSILCEIYEGLLKFDENLKPVLALAESMDVKNGIEYTFKIKQNIYFHDGSLLTAKDVKFSLERAISSEVFEPKIQFYYSDEIDGKLPKEIVNLPIPILEFGKITLDEAIEKFKRESYYKSHETNTEMGGFNIITNSEDFPKIWIDQDGGKYALACAIAQDFRVINSENIVVKLNAAGFTEKGAQTIETYLNREKKAMAQIDRAGNFGVPCVAFNVIE